MLHSFDFTSLKTENIQFMYFFIKCNVYIIVKILDRKNMELEEIKSHYRNKITEMETAAKKQERKGKAPWSSPVDCQPKKKFN